MLISALRKSQTHSKCSPTLQMEVLQSHLGAQPLLCFPRIRLMKTINQKTNQPQRTIKGRKKERKARRGRWSTSKTKSLETTKEQQETVVQLKQNMGKFHNVVILSHVLLSDT